jgi:putative transposase
LARCRAFIQSATARVFRRRQPQPIARRRPDDPRLRERLVALAHERRRFGYRRLLIFLPRLGAGRVRGRAPGG